MYKIIIADDEPIILDGMKKSTEWSRFNCAISGLASNGEEACRMIAEIKPHVAFLDLKMPGMNGIEVIEKSREVSPDTKFIIVSGYADFYMAKDAMRLGVTYYLLKPVSSVEMEEALIESLSHFENTNSVCGKYEILESGESYEVDASEDDYNKLEKVYRYVEENLGNPNLTLGIIAKDIAFMNANYFGRVFKKITGLFYTQYVMNRRLEKAKQLLTNTEIKIFDIAEAVGFAGNEKYFGQVFKRQTGMTPGEYRQKNV